MEKEYEYIDSRYSRAVSAMKAALFDVLAIEKKKTTLLEKELEDAIDAEKAEISKKIDVQKENLDKILSDTDSIINSIEKLDSINVEMTNTSNNELDETASLVDESVTDEKENDDKTEDVTESTSVDEDEPTLKISLDDEDDKEVEESTNDNSLEEDSDEEVDSTDEEVAEEKDVDLDIEIPVVDQAKEDKELDETNDVVENDEETKKVDTPDQNVVEKEHTEQTLAFTRENKKVIKAILVKQTQLDNLKSSREKQKQVVDTLGLFNNYDYLINTQNALDGSLKAKEDFDIEIDVNADKERQIEDLMVKASIYTSEGETDKAQAIYDKINELNAQDGDDSAIEDEQAIEKVKAA